MILIIIGFETVFSDVSLHCPMGKSDASRRVMPRENDVKSIRDFKVFNDPNDLKDFKDLNAFVISC